MQSSTYRSVASRMFCIASSRVSPWDAQPGNAGTLATYPPSASCSKMTVYRIFDLICLSPGRLLRRGSEAQFAMRIHIYNKLLAVADLAFQDQTPQRRLH